MATGTNPGKGRPPKPQAAKTATPKPKKVVVKSKTRQKK